VRERVQELLALVGLNPYFINRYPHEFSGGQRRAHRYCPCLGCRTRICGM
jgi:ABC-type microcin C transport system duplicated ATPase subunit YejF